MKNLILLLMILILLAPAILPAKTTVSEVEKNLMCTCDCTMALYTCECGRSGEMRAEIQGMIDKGMDKEQIIAAYVGQFGERILSAPTKEGFNLTAWIMPFLALGLAGGLLYKTLRRWSSIRPVATAAPDEHMKTGYEQKLQQELANFEEGEIS